MNFNNHVPVAQAWVQEDSTSAWTGGTTQGGWGQMAGAALSRSGWGSSNNTMAIPVPTHDNVPTSQVLVPYPPNYLTYSPGNETETRMVPYQNYWNTANRNRGT